MPRLCPRPKSSDAGFALVAVIWSLGLITLLGTVAIVGARYRTKMTTSLASVTAAASAAESAVNLGIAMVLTATPGQSAKFPLRCQLPGGERVTISVEEEAGKVDLNTATPTVLARLFAALTFDQSAGTRIAENIGAFRDPGRDETEARTAGKKTDDGRFTTIMELDRINGISPALFRRALRFVTVRSGRPEPDADAASPALRELLKLDQKPAGPTRGPTDAGEVTIRADVSAQDGGRFIREALVSLGSESGRPFLIREWRHGDVVLDTQPRTGVSAPEGSCFRVGGRSETGRPARSDG
jgi:general secretion pathway protein K